MFLDSKNFFRVKIFLESRFWVKFFLESRFFREFWIKIFSRGPHWSHGLILPLQIVTKKRLMVFNILHCNALWSYGTNWALPSLNKTLYFDLNDYFTEIKICMKNILSKIRFYILNYNEKSESKMAEEKPETKDLKKFKDLVNIDKLEGNIIGLSDFRFYTSKGT